MKNFQTNDFLPAPIYPITDAHRSGLSHAAQVEQLIAGGANLIQLREKHRSAKEFFADAVRAIEIARRAGNVKIIINDRVDIALAARADGVHLGQTDLPPLEARKILGETAIIGFSTHNLAQAVAAQNLPLDYIAVGPIFATATKENPDAVVGLDNLQIIRRAVGNLPLVAIGGINRENFVSVLNSGAHSVALISALHQKSSISKTFAEFQTEINRR